MNGPVRRWSWWVIAKASNVLQRYYGWRTGLPAEQFVADWVFDGGKSDPPNLDWDNFGNWTEPVTVQLEAPAMPFPKETT